MIIPFAGRRVCLIGGAGFIGHNLALELKRLGAHVDVIDGLQVNNLVTFTANVDKAPHRDLYLSHLNQRIRLLQEAEVPLHVQDARDYAALSHLLNVIQPDVIVMLAAVSHAGRANKNPYNTFDHSMRTLENALDCARGNVDHFVFFSSSMVYGNFQEAAVSEDAICEPLGIYGALKFGGEKLVIAYNQVFDLPYTIVRPSALYGERCVSRRVVQVFAENALMGIPLRINGDGEDRLDFTYIDDLVQGLVKSIENTASRNEVFNITYGDSRSINQLVEIIRTRVPSVRVEHQPADQLMPERGTLCIDKARALLDYEPQFPLEVALPRYLDWYENTFEKSPELLSSP